MKTVRIERCPWSDGGGETDVFDIGASMDGDHVTMLDSQVVADNSVDASAAVIELLVSEDNEDRLLSLLASDEHGVAAEELERVHGGLGERDDAVIIVDGIGNPKQLVSISRARVRASGDYLHQLVGLLLLLENGRRGVIFLERRLEIERNRGTGGQGGTNVLDLGARGIAINNNKRQLRTHYTITSRSTRSLAGWHVRQVDLLVVGLVGLLGSHGVVWGCFREAGAGSDRRR